MLYVADTNIVSEPLKPNPDGKAIDWMQDHADCICLTTVTLMEMHFGIMRLPEGKRKRALYERIRAISEDCRDRILPFDSFSAYLCADLRCKAQAAGRVPQLADIMIAAICKCNNAILATHNTRDFGYLDIELVDPFEYESEALKRLRRKA